MAAAGSLVEHRQAQSVNSIQNTHKMAKAIINSSLLVSTVHHLSVISLAISLTLAD